MELFSSVSPVYIIIENNETLQKKVVPAHDYQANSYNDFISTTLITNKQEKLYNPSRGKHFKLQYTDKTNAPFYPKDAREDVVLVTLTRRDILNRRDTTTSIMSTDKAFLEQYAKILNANTQRNNDVYIILKKKERDDTRRITYKINRAVPANIDQKNAYNDFISKVDRRDIKTIIPYDSFSLKYNFRMNDPNYSSYQENEYVLVDFISNDGSKSEMSSNEDFLKGRAAWINRMSDEYDTGPYTPDSPDYPDSPEYPYSSYSAGGRKSMRRKSIRRKSIRRKSIRRKKYYM